MKSKVSLAAVGVFAMLVSGATSLQADARKGHTYKVKFTQVANTCEGIGISLNKADFKISPVGKSKSLAVEIPMIPVMKGRAGKKGKFSARAKKGKTAIEGLDGKFSVSGTVSDKGVIKLMFFAEYFKGKTPMCTTSWNGKGS